MQFFNKAPLSLLLLFPPMSPALNFFFLLLHVFAAFPGLARDSVFSDTHLLCIFGLCERHQSRQQKLLAYLLLSAGAPVVGSVQLSLSLTGRGG